MPTDTAFLKRRRQTWYFQIAVPRDVQAALAKESDRSKPVTVLVESLKTRDKTEAQRLRWEKHLDALARFDRLRGKRTLTVAEIEEAAEETMRGFLEAAHATAEKGAPIASAPEETPEGPGEFTERGGLELRLDALQDALAAQEYELARPHIRRVIERTGAIVTPGSREFDEIAQSQLRALIEAVRGRLAFLDGKPYEPRRPFTKPDVDPLTLTIQTPRRPRKRVTDPNSEPIADASARYVAEMMRDESAAWTVQTQRQNEVTFRLFADYVNDSAITSITRKDASGFLDTIATLSRTYGKSADDKGKSLGVLLEKYGNKGKGLSNKTLNRHVTALHGLFKWAKARDLYAEENPFSGQMRKAGENPYLPWNKEELKALVNAPLLRETPAKDRVTPTKHTLDHALMWAPLIALFAGLRSEEICQLKPSDVRRESGVWFFNVSEEDGGTVKTSAGTRKVPVHSALIRMGFLQYVARVTKHPSGRLFPGLRPYGRDKKLNGYITRRMGAYFEAIGVKRPMVTFHSFRKNVVGALERERVHQSEIARLVGHEPGFTVKTYNPVGLGLRELRAIVEKIKYPGLKLAHLYVK